MDEREQGTPAREPEVPLGQRLYDNTPLLFVAGFLVMLVLFTAWGLVEVATLPDATLP